MLSDSFLDRHALLLQGQLVNWQSPHCLVLRKAVVIVLNHLQHLQNILRNYYHKAFPMYSHLIVDDGSLHYIMQE